MGLSVPLHRVVVGRRDSHFFLYTTLLLLTAKAALHGKSQETLCHSSTTRESSLGMV